MENTTSSEKSHEKPKTVRKVFSGILIALGLLYFIPNEDHTAYIGAMFLSTAFLVSNTFSAICENNKVKLSEGKRIATGISLFIVPLFVNALFGNTDSSSVWTFILTAATDIIILSLISSKEAKKQKKKTSKKQSTHQSRPVKTEQKTTSNVNNGEDKAVKNAPQREPEENRQKKLVQKFQSMDLYSSVIIAKMLSDYNEIWSSEEYLPKINIADLLAQVYLDAIGVQTEEQLDALFDANYFKQLYSEYFKSYRKYFRNNYYKAGIDAASHKSRLNDIFTMISESYKNKVLIYCLNDKKASLSWARNTDFGEYANGINHTYDTLCLAASLGTMIFVNNKADSLNTDNDLGKMVANGSKKRLSVKMFVKKLYPIYIEHYYKDLQIRDQRLFQIIVEIVFQKESEKKLHEQYARVLSHSDKWINFVDEQVFEMTISQWLDGIASDNANIPDEEVSRLTVARIMMDLADTTTLNLLIYALMNLKKENGVYKKLRAERKRLKDRDRFIKGDFSEELNDFRDRFDINKISTGTQFEFYLKDLLEEVGYKVEHTGGNGDQGADLIAKYGSKKYAIQAKFYTSPLDNTPVQEVIGSLKYYNARQGVVITNSTFTQGAARLAKANSVTLIDGRELKKMIDRILEQHGQEDIIALIGDSKI